MTEFKVFRIDGEQLPSVQAEFSGEASARALHQTVVALRNGARQGTVKTKERNEIRGGGKKPWRQKGTGHARQGSRSAPHWRGGGTVFGPRPRDYRELTNRQVLRQAFRAALAARAREDAVRIIEGLEGLDGKTAGMLQALLRLNVERIDQKRVLLVAIREEELVHRAARNLSFVTVHRPEQINTLDLLGNDVLVATRAAFDQLAKRVTA